MFDDTLIIVTADHGGYL